MVEENRVIENCFFIEKVGVKILPGEIVADLDPSKRVNLVSSVLRKIPKFINLWLPSFNATGIPNIAVSPYTRAKYLNNTGRETSKMTGSRLAMVLK